VEHEAAVLRIARRDLARGQSARARDQYEQILQDDPSNPEALVGLTYVALATGAAEEARGLAERAVKARPDHLEAQILKVVVGEALGDRDGAVAQMSDLAKANPESCLAAYHAGRLLAASDRGEEALAMLRRAVDLVDQVGRRCDILNLMGYVLQDLDRLGEAIRAHRRAVELFPTSSKGYEGLADACARGGDIDAALSVLDEAVVKVAADDHSALWQKQAELLASRGDFPAAVARAERACEGSPQDAQGWLNLASLRLLAGDTAGAEQAARRAGELDPAAWQPHFQRGMICDAAGQGDKAEVAYRKAVDAAPERWEPTNNLGLVMLAHGSPADLFEAEQLFRQATELAGPIEVQPRFNLARALARLQQHVECRKLCDDLLAGDLPAELRQRVQAQVGELP
jgi:Flp pilus assembly protein TadD